MAKLSIIVPVYNVEKYIHKCLESVYSQDVPMDIFEVIVVNDGTPDNSMTVVQEFNRKYENLKIIEQENQGLSMARNNGLAAAKGEYVWFVDSDDSIMPHSISYILKNIEKEKAHIFISKLVIINENSNDEKNEYDSNYSGELRGKKYLFSKLPSGTAQRYVIQKEFLISNNLFFTRGIYHEDTEFGVKILYLAHRVYILNYPIYKYLIRSTGSIMSSWKLKNSEDMVKIYLSLEAFGNKFVNSEDICRFNLRIYRVLLFSIILARKNLNNKIFNNFYINNKNLIKNRAKKIKISFKIDKLQVLELIFCRVSPLYYVKVKFFLKNIIRGHIRS